MLAISSVSLVKLLAYQCTIKGGLDRIIQFWDFLYMNRVSKTVENARAINERGQVCGKAIYQSCSIGERPDLFQPKTTPAR